MPDAMREERPVAVEGLGHFLRRDHFQLGLLQPDGGLLPVDDAVRALQGSIEVHLFHGLLGNLCGFGRLVATGILAALLRFATVFLRVRHRRAVFRLLRRPGLDLAHRPVLLFVAHLALELVEPRALAAFRRDVLALGRGKGLHHAVRRSDDGALVALFVVPLPDNIAGLLLLIPLLVAPQHPEDPVGQRCVARTVRVPRLEQAAHDGLILVGL
mmetsp:Transcript_116360/g.334120  ORF Transcript_116360/g.334120 Transcript_116360/m.334120 type:complete len:214 (+) Transcript_116360:1087-1728(+)